MTTRLTVNAAKPYDIVVGPSAMAELPDLLAKVSRVAVIHPPTLREKAQAMRGVLSLGYSREVHLIEVPDGERAKSLEVLAYCWDVLGDAGFTRSDAVIGFGGGSTTDLAGFVAASWLRGVPFINLPTTVLGMVDAAVGGKTGINTASGKNLVGAFHEPVAVLCDLDALVDLPLAEIRSGLAEVVKCGFIADPTILDLIEADPTRALVATSAEISELIVKSITVKINAVEGDLKETSSDAGGAIGREALNYGHTLGHALERVHEYRIRHGEAISIGMVFAAELAHLTDEIDAKLLERHRSILRSLGLPTIMTKEFEPLLQAMRLDKKTRGKTLRFVILDALASPKILRGPSEEVLRAAYAALSA